MHVYLSSTYRDLKTYRATLATALRKAHYQVTMMEEYAARDELVEFACQGDVAKCDAYIGVFAWRYGYVPEGSRMSVTEMEHAAAVDKNIPVRVFLLRDEAAWPPELKDKRASAIRKLRKRLKRYCAGYFADEHELAAEALASLRVLESTRLAQQIEAIDVIRKGQELGPSYLMNIQNKLGALRAAPMIEFQIGKTPWWNTRLYLVAALAEDLGGTREFVFVDDEGGFLCMAPPAEIRRRLRARWPLLEQAYAEFRSEAVTSTAVEEQLWRYPIAVSTAFGQIEPGAKEDVTAQDLQHGLGIRHDAETVPFGDQEGQVSLQRKILERATPFAAVIRNGRLEGLVERAELALKVAEKAHAQLG